MASLRAGILGFGMSGRVFHGPLIAATEGLEVAVVATRDPARQAEAQESYPTAGVVSDLDALLARPQDVDFVVVTTPNDTHEGFSRRVIEAGLPVVIEKPAAVTAAGARAIAEFAQSRGVPHAVFQNRRWDADYLTLIDALEASSIGEVFRLETRMQDFAPTVDSGWRNDANPSSGGGVLLDLGAHLVDQCVQLLGPVAAVFAEISSERPGSVVPDDVFVSLQHATGTRSHIRGSRIGSGPLPRFHAQGTRGSVTIMGRDGQEAQLEAGLRPGSPRWGILQPPAATIVDGDGVWEHPARRGAQETFYALWRDHLLDLGPSPVAGSDPAYVLSILDAAALSARDQRVITLPVDDWATSDATISLGLQ